MDIRSMIKAGQLKMGSGAKVVVGGHRIRLDDGAGTRFTTQPMDQRKQDRRAANKRARKARRKGR